MELITAVAIGTMFGVGIFQLLRRNVIRAAIGLIIISNAINLFLLSAGAYDGVMAAYITDDVAEIVALTIGERSDALPQVLVLTAIVISMGGFSLVLAMLYILSARYKTSDLDEVKGLRY
jgi:multicomponent Na+:H+ antiporter subunit C